MDTNDWEGLTSTHSGLECIREASENSNVNVIWILLVQSIADE
jgi:hypothetical protein